MKALDGFNIFSTDGYRYEITPDAQAALARVIIRSAPRMSTFTLSRTAVAYARHRLDDSGSTTTADSLDDEVRAALQGEFLKRIGEMDASQIAWALIGQTKLSRAGGAGPGAGGLTVDGKR